MGPVQGRPLHEELGIEGDAAVRLRVELHPAVDAVGVELRVDRAVEFVK